MTNGSKRARRRVTVARKKKQARRRIQETVKPASGTTAEISPREIGRRATTSTLCSCFMCGNPRKHEKGDSKRTPQEKKVKLAQNEQTESSEEGDG